MTITRFLVLSIVFHLAIAVGFSLLPKRAKEKTREIMARLVTPEEIRQPAPIPPPPPSPAPKIRQLPPAGKQAPKPPQQRQRRAAPPPSAVIRTTPTPDRPVVPGFGREEGKPLPEGVIPRGEPEGGKGGAQEKSKIPDLDQYSDKPGYLPKEGLFDRNIIGDIARRKTAPEGVKEGTKDRPVTFDTREYRYAGYMRKLKEKIESIWEYPAEARARGLYGDLRIRFTIRKDGKLGAVELVRTSGYKGLDDAAIKALKDGEPYWPLPDEWGLDSYTINGHFIYSYYGYSIR